jgi:hypothetical protein
MKSRMCRVWGLGLSLLVLPLAGGCLPQASSSVENAVVAAETEKPSPPVVAPLADEPVAPVEAADDENSAEISDAPATPVSDDITVPANLRPSPAASEVIKLANSGVGESVLLTVVTNSTGTFNLRPEEIIYLTDIGVPPAVVTAMLQHDHLLQAREPYVSELSLVPAASGAATQPVAANQFAPEPTVAVAPDQPAGTIEAAPQYAPVSYAVPEVTAAPAEPESAPDFYDSLAPYGTWVDVGGYGWCWQPTAIVINPAWQPYCDHGHWVYSSCGWYWMSDYSWGWAPFHYGRWLQHQNLGWCWVPDHVWGPSWVCWRYSQNYCGWAALPPAAGFTAGVGMTFHGHKAGSDSSFGLAANQFHFVPTDRFTDRHVNRHVVSRDQAVKIFGDTVASTTTTLRNDTVVISGIPRDRIAATSHKPVPHVTLRVNPSTVPPPGGQPFSDKVLRRPATELNRFAAKQAQLSGSQAREANVASAPSLPQKPFAVASLGSGTVPLPRNNNEAAPLVTAEKANVTRVISQPQPGKPAPLIIRGPSRPATAPRAGNSTLVVIGSRHPAPAAGFTHNTPQPVHLPSAQQPPESLGIPSDRIGNSAELGIPSDRVGNSSELGIPSDRIGNSTEQDPPARFHQALNVPRPPTDANASTPQQLPWWMNRPAAPPAGQNGANQSPAQPNAPAYVNHPAPASAPAHHNSAPSQPASSSGSHSQAHSAPSAPASHSQSSASKGSR